MSRGLTLLLILANVLCASLLTWLWVGADGTLRGVHWQPPAAIRPDLGSLSAAATRRDDADTARFMAMLDRPVFSPTRRPPPPPPPPKVVVPVPPDPLNTIHLYGFFASEGGGGLIAQVDGKTRRVRVSEAIGDWVLKEIRPSAVVFARRGETRIVPLAQAKQTPAMSAPRPAFAAPQLPAPAEAPPSAAPVRAAPVPMPSSPAPPPAGAPAGGATKPSSPFVIGGSR